MFGTFSPHTLTPTASLQVSTTAATPTSPTRSSRLRGLSYLRSYTHNHLHHRSPSPSSASSTAPSSRPPLSRSNSTPTGGRHQSRSLQTTQAEHKPHVLPSPQRSAASSNNAAGDAPISGWQPTVGGQSGLSRVAPLPQPTPTDSSTSTSNSITAAATIATTIAPAVMTRRRAATGVDEPPAAALRQELSRTVTATGTPTAAAAPAVETRDTTEASIPKRDMPTIRLIPHHEPRASRPSLTFPIVTRTLTTQSTKVKVGRYSERDSGAADALTNPLSTAPVGFKSKVVSRRHCELWCDGGQWFIKDVKSSSGTFLNHVRLSSPGMESRAYPVNDGDVVQLGIDFKGGEEQIFRCVKIRVECNRGWQKSLNQFNTSTHKRLLKSTQKSASSKDSDAQSTHSSECSICLCPVAPCQALFVAPCSHVWHYKCIRTLIYSPGWPSFQCPNCRAYADLEADVDQPEEEEEEEFEEFNDDSSKQPQDDASQKEPTEGSEEPATAAATAAAAATSNAVHGEDDDDVDLAEMITSVSARGSSPSPQPPTETSASGSDGEVEAASTTTTQPVPITASTAAPVNNILPDSIMARSATPTSTAQFALAAGVLIDGGPTTPMNDVGPFVFDGSASRRFRPVDDMARGAVREEADEK